MGFSVGVMARLVCVDPGNETGLAYIDYLDTETPVLTHAEEFVLAPYETYERLFEAVGVQDALKVVIEGWDPFGPVYKPDPNYSCQLIGAVKAAAGKWSVEVIERMPYQRVQVSDKMLKDNGFWWPHGKGHARSAIKHGLSYLLDEHHRPTMELLFKRGGAR